MLQNPLPTCGKEITIETLVAIASDHRVCDIFDDWVSAVIEGNTDHQADWMMDVCGVLTDYVGDMGMDADCLLRTVYIPEDGDDTPLWGHPSDVFTFSSYMGMILFEDGTKIWICAGEDVQYHGPEGHTVVRPAR